MWTFPQGYILYPWIIKVIFVTFFLLQLFANYVAVQRWILPRDIIKEMPLRTVTSCVMECSRTDKCLAIGFRKDPELVKNDKCLLLKLLRKKNKNGKRIKIFALVDKEKALKEEKKEKFALIKQQACPVDVNGGYGKWSDFTVCSKSCGSGTHHRNRSCDNPSPKFGGRNCSVLGNATEMRRCNVHPCPIDGGFGQWSGYGKCSRSCATGKQQRSRACDTPAPMYGGKNCSSLGKSKEERSCNTKPCPVDGGFGQWSGYGKCSRSCATGKQQRSRACDTPAPMYGGKNCSSLGKSKEERSCNTKPCPVMIQLQNPYLSSTYSAYYASKAINGKTTDYAATKIEKNGWWKAELTQPSHISIIRIMPQEYGQKIKRYKGVTVSTSIDGAIWTLCDDMGDRINTATPMTWVEATCPQGTVGQFVKLQQAYTQHFCLREVQVFGNPEDNTATRMLDRKNRK